MMIEAQAKMKLRMLPIAIMLLAFSIAVGFIIISLFPYLQRNKDPTWRLHQVANALLLYSLDNNGNLPTNLDLIATSNRYDPKGIVNNLLRQSSYVDYEGANKKFANTHNHDNILTIIIYGNPYHIIRDGTILGSAKDGG